jgi:hypothetical protein
METQLKLNGRKLIKNPCNVNIGQPGFGIAFASSYGDGTYEVFATYDKGSTIVKVEIELA